MLLALILCSLILGCLASMEGLRFTWGAWGTCAGGLHWGAAAQAAPAPRPTAARHTTGMALADARHCVARRKASPGRAEELPAGRGGGGVGAARHLPCAACGGCASCLPPHSPLSVHAKPSPQPCRQAGCQPAPAAQAFAVLAAGSSCGRRGTSPPEPLGWRCHPADPPREQERTPRGETRQEGTPREATRRASLPGEGTQRGATRQASLPGAGSR
jgi:hypothetical protein